MLAKGTIIDQRFEIISCLGIGGFGSVYKAKQVGLDRVVALKILQDLLDEGESKARFEREAAILSNLTHKNLALFYGYGYLNSAPYMVMEFVPGRTLEELIEEKNGLSVDDTIEIARQLCEALQCVHAQGIVHRDLKPNNVIITEGDTGRPVLKLIDFGLALFNPLTGESAQRLTEAGTTIGTVQFMAPEQCLGEEIDQRSDIYSLGCMLYNCLAGKAPFEGADCITIMRQQSFDEPPALVPKEEVTPRYQGLLNIIDRAMCKSPADRFQDSSSMLEEITNLPNLTSVVKSPRLHVTGNQNRSKFEIKNRRSIVGVLAMAAAVTGVALFAVQTLLGTQAPQSKENSIAALNLAKEMTRAEKTELAAENFFKVLKLNQQDHLLSDGQVDYVKMRLAQELAKMQRYEEAANLSEDALKSIAKSKHHQQFIPAILTCYTTSMEALRKYERATDFLLGIKSALAGRHGDWESQLSMSIAKMYADRSLWAQAKATLDGTPVDYISSPTDHMVYYKLYVRAFKGLGMQEAAASYERKLASAKNDELLHHKQAAPITRIDLAKIRPKLRSTPSTP